MKKINAWKTSDGKIFESKDKAIKHQYKIDNNLTRSLRFDVNRDFMIQWLKDEEKREEDFSWKEFDIDKDSLDKSELFYHEGGWECEHPENPIDVCVYHPENGECCIFCYQPKERK